jgi:hypothetical protein
VLWNVQKFDVLAWVALSSVVCLSLPAVMGFAFRGGPVFRFMKIVVLHQDGQPASRLRCAWRNFLAFAGCLYFYSVIGAFNAKMLVSMWSGSYSPAEMFRFDNANPALGGLLLFSLCSSEILLVVFIAGAIYALVRPQRGLQDLLAETRLVPR